MDLERTIQKFEDGKGDSGIVFVTCSGVYYSIRKPYALLSDEG